MCWDVAGRLEWEDAVPASATLARGAGALTDTVPLGCSSRGFPQLQEPACTSAWVPSSGYTLLPWLISRPASHCHRLLTKILYCSLQEFDLGRVSKRFSSTRWIRGYNNFVGVS